MQIFKTLEDIDIHKNSCITIGNFDGVHKGHQHILNQVIQHSQKNNLQSIAVTFHPHPQRLLTGQKKPPFITLLQQKLELLEETGISAVFCIPFTWQMASLPPEEFVKIYLVDALRIRHLIVGYDYAFGKNRSGNFQTLQELGKKYNYSVSQSEALNLHGATISSTRIRKMIENGQVFEARHLLGRFYRVEGRVVHGQNRGGRLLGYPTANLCLTDELFPLPGVYAVFAEYENAVMPAVANIGFNPTFNNNILTIEVHIMNFSEDLYDKQLRVHFVQNLRTEKKFNSLDELKAQINTDTELATEILTKNKKELYDFIWLSKNTNQFKQSK